jgi:CubicO group peptidase (beta-lactamase class C family)
VTQFAQAAGLLEKAIAAHAFPAASVEIGRAAGVTWRAGFGRLTYAEDAPRATEETIFDLASLTKVIVTTTLIMQAVDAGALSLTDCVTDRLNQWHGLDRQTVTIADLLEHASGLTAYLPFFRDHRGRSEFERAICTLPLEYTPRTKSIYSDLGFILLGFMLEDINHAPFAQQFEYEGLRFNPPGEWRERTAPTELDLWRGRLLQGEVHDENTWALGGAAGHAGLFGTAAATGTFARLVLRGLNGGRTIARTETLARFMTKSSVPGSSRALGWDTMLTTSSCGTGLSPRAIGHTGFTGTSLWIDPELDLYIVLLTNRVHPTRENNAIQSVRRAFHDSVIGALRDPAINQSRSS